MADRAIRLSLYLAREDTARGDLIRPEYREGGERELERLTILNELSFECDAFVSRGSEKRPPWVLFTQRHFNVSDVRTRSAAFVLVFDSADRHWALTFGHGWHAIDPSVLEPGFGLRVCANSIDPAAVRSLANRRVGSVTRQQITHMSKASKVAELGVLLDQEWIRSLTGRSATAAIGGMLSGSDAFHFSFERSLQDVATTAVNLLERFHSEDYKENFRFIDQLRTLGWSEVQALGLDEELLDLISKQDVDDLHLAPTEIPDDAYLSGYRVWSGGKRADLSELDIEAFYDALGSLPVADDLLDGVRLAPLNDEGRPAVRDPLRRYVVAEVRRGDDLYVHSLGSWFRIDADYAASITRQVAEIPDVTDVLGLPSWGRETDGKYAGTHHETSYNKRTAQDLNWVLFDDDSIPHGGRNQKIELCDLLDDSDRHIFLKRAKSSATLSHLWAQAAVTCELYRNDSAFVEKAYRKLETLSPGRAFPDLTRPSFVYAIGTKKVGPLCDTLFFFSKLALVAKYAELRGRGADVSLARVAMVD
jgi:uncharacterized protein (TIGR04141 family)